jgi:HEAT repeat protein
VGLISVAGNTIMRRSRPWLVAACCPLLALSVAWADPPKPAANPEDEKLLKDAKVGVEAADLLGYFRKHTLSAAEQDKIQGLIQQLGDDAFKVRQKAMTDLTALGANAVPLLRRAQDDPDEEVKERARDLLAAAAAAGANDRAAQSAAAARLLRVKAPEGAVAVLLAYLPDADNDAVEEEVLLTLAALGVKDGKVDAALAAALKDKAAGRRGAAGLVLGRSGTADQRADAKGLLNDPDPRVRFRTAQGLLAARDRDGLPVLIGLLKDGSPDLAVRAEELLCCAAGYRAPHIPFSEDGPLRANCVKAWNTWQKNYGKTVDLSKADVDLPPNNQLLEARDVLRRFYNALSSGNEEAFRKAADVPFHLQNAATYAGKDDLGRFFANDSNNFGLKNPGMYPAIISTLPLEEYRRVNPNGQGATPEERAFVDKLKLKPADAVVFLVQMYQVGQPLPNPPDATNGIVTLVRFGPDGPRVIAIGQRNGVRSW